MAVSSARAIASTGGSCGMGRARRDNISLISSAACSPPQSQLHIASYHLRNVSSLMWPLVAAAASRIFSAGLVITPIPSLDRWVSLKRGQDAIFVVGMGCGFGFLLTVVETVNPYEGPFILCAPPCFEYVI